MKLVDVALEYLSDKLAVARMRSFKVDTAEVGPDRVFSFVEWEGVKNDFEVELGEFGEVVEYLTGDFVVCGVTLARPDDCQKCLIDVMAWRFEVFLLYLCPAFLVVDQHSKEVDA